MVTLYAFAFGMNISTSALVGLELGKENPHSAKRNGNIA
jgi:Na+-driven multidrug efflux pump